MDSRLVSASPPAPTRGRREPLRVSGLLAGLGLLLALCGNEGWAASISISAGTAPAARADGLCSLVEAIINANRDARTHADCPPGNGPDVIVLPSNSTQSLTAIDNRSYGTTGLPVVTSEITIEGNNSRIVRASSAPAFRLATVTGKLILKNVTLQGGAQPTWDNASGVRNGGCGILISQGTVHLENSTVCDNSCYYRGGGIYNHYGQLRVINSLITRNTGSTGGGLAQYHGTAEVTDSVISENLANKNDGGGIYNGASNLTLSHSTVRDNRANYGGGIRQEWDSRSTISDSNILDNHAITSGGGIENGAFASLTICSSTIVRNSSDGRGGGLTGTMSHNGTLVVNTTISGNTAGTTGGGVSIWGEGVTTLTRSTIAFNHANGSGGGLFTANSPTLLSNTLVTGNSADGTGPEMVCQGALCSRYATVNHFNLFGYAGRAGLVGFSPGTRDIVPTQPLAAILDSALDNNGGATLTHALLPGSAAIDAGDPDFEKVIYGRTDIYDQRGPGFLRLGGPHMDIGAFEVQP